MAGKRKPYNEKNDKKQDAKTTKGLSTAEKSAFKKLDTAHGKRNKPETQTADRKIDEKLKKKAVKKVEKRHEAKEGKAGEKREDIREKKQGKK
jgi:hypothetical protein